MVEQRLEDAFGDIVRKARTGLGLEMEEVAQRAGLNALDLKRVERYEFVPEDAVIAALAQTLGLRATCLIDIARGRWWPLSPDLSMWGSLVELRSLYGGYEVKNYLLWDAARREAALFDTGMATDTALRTIEEGGLTLSSIFLTHTHADHIGKLEVLRRRFYPRVFVGAGESLMGAEIVKEGDILRVGGLTVQVLETGGHSPGGVTYVVGGFAGGLPSVAFVGDALFAGSVGNPNVSYERLLSNVRKKILGLPDQAVLCPGHGPLTTVAQEKAHNPFYA